MQRIFKYLMAIAILSFQAIAWGQFNNQNVYVPDYIRLVKSDADLDPTKGSIVVMPFRFKNQFKPDYPMMNFGFIVDKLGGPHIRDGVLIKYANETKDGWRYFPTSLWLVPGKYRIIILSGVSQAYAVIARSLMESSIEFEVTEVGKMIYLGRTDLLNVRRTSLENITSGYPTPIMDQALSGLANGTPVVSLHKETQAEWLEQYQSSPLISRLRDYEIKEGIITKYVLTGSDRHQRARTFVFNDSVKNNEANPLITPIKSDFADIKDIAKFLSITSNSNLKQSYEAFLNSRITRAIVISPDGKNAYAASSDSPFDSPVLSAYSDCQKNHGTGCKFYAIDSDVVWSVD
jgi:hypothetical protein